jgi:hypothetical protein
MKKWMLVATVLAILGGVGAFTLSNAAPEGLLGHGCRVVGTPGC